MSAFSAASAAHLAEAAEPLQRLFARVVQTIDCSIIVGHRNREEQNSAYRNGRSTKPWPGSKHNSLPARAVDAAPYPIDWNDKARFYYFAGFVLGTAKELSIPIRWGGDWDGDNDLSDQHLFDLVHFELI